MNRIRKYLNSNGQRKLLIPFFTAGFPDSTKFLDLIEAATDAGADFIEIGLPFSDPLADGPEIQYSSYQALRSGTNLKKILKSIDLIRKKNDTPLILMGYYNPILTYGQTKFLNDAQSAGADGLIIPDLPVDEAAEFKRSADSNHLSSIFLVAPTSSPDRIKRIDKLSTDFVYAVTVTGVTGSGRKFDKDTDSYLKGLRKSLTKHYVAGFGVSSPESAYRLAQNSDGIVIGSKLISIIRNSKDKRRAVNDVGRLLTAIRKKLT